MFLPAGDGSPRSMLNRAALLAEQRVDGVVVSLGEPGLGGAFGSIFATGKSLLTRVASAPVGAPVMGNPVRVPLVPLLRCAGVSSCFKVSPVTGLTLAPDGTVRSSRA